MRTIRVAHILRCSFCEAKASALFEGDPTGVDYLSLTAAISAGWTELAPRIWMCPDHNEVRLEQPAQQKRKVPA